MDREAAIVILDEFIQNINLKRHMLAVEAAMRAYAKYYNEDPDEWGLAGLLHDFDWEIHPTLEKHPQQGAPILRERGVPELIIRCILSHADHTGIMRESRMEHALYACDEITGLIVAVALVRPSRSLQDLKARSVRKKWKNTRFAANVNRDEIERGAAELGVEIWDHVDRVIQAMRPIEEELGLGGHPQTPEGNSS
jgi:putative nucleotidyltransferase with HDIG domain